MSARNSTGFWVVERAEAETAALRRLQYDLGNTPLGDGGSLWPFCLTSREYWSKVRLGQDARDFRAFVALNLDPAVLDRAAGAAGALHRPGQLLLFRQTDADKVFHHRHRLAAAPGLLPDDVHAPAIS